MNSIKKDLNMTEVKQHENQKTIASGNTFRYSRRAVVTLDGNQNFVSSQSMKPCKYELENFGVCSKHNDTHHNQFNYHFAYIISSNKKPVYEHQVHVHCNNKKRVICKYSKDKCWEKNNSEHNKVFYHPKHLSYPLQHLNPLGLTTENPNIQPPLYMRSIAVDCC